MAVMLEMEMPKYCLEAIGDNYRVVKICPIRELCIRKWGGYIGALNVHSDACPLVEVPPHGRLGDLDALAEHIRNVYCKDCKRSKVMCKACEYGDMLDEIEDAPTVIEASKGSE